MKLRQNTKIRVVTGDISFFTTVKQIREGFSTSMRFTAAVNAALKALENQTTKLVQPIGIGGRWKDFPIQLDIVQ